MFISCCHCRLVIFIETGFGLTVSKIRRLSHPDDALGSGIDYTYVEDQEKFLTDDATLRLA